MAKKNKLNKGQARRIRANQARKLKQAKQAEIWQDDELGEPQSGLVISRFGQHADVEAANGDVFRCNIRRSIDSLVCGDKVLWRAGKTTQHSISGVIEAVEPRQSELCRPDVYDGLKPIAANIDTIFIVSSKLPAFNTDIIDRYLVATEQTGIHVEILLNKADLLNNDDIEVEQACYLYRKLGYPVTKISTKTEHGLDELTAKIQHKVNIFVGQSGVGKSSIVNKLMPHLELDTQAVSDSSGLGQHTTTVARLYHLPSGGDLIDSPGIREFGLWHLTAEQVFDGFIEFAPFKNGCKFRDCKHKNDPGCILREAVEQGKISQARFDSYHRIVDSLDSNKLTSRFND